MLDFNILSITRSPIDIWQLKNYGTLSYELYTYRINFLSKIKNINRYKKTSIGTPYKVDRIINCFDRKIKNIPIFTDEVRLKYLNGINNIYTEYYQSTYENKTSKKMAYLQYQTDIYFKYNKKMKIEVLNFKEFKKSGLVNKYKKL